MTVHSHYLYYVQRLQSDSEDKRECNLKYVSIFTINQEITDCNHIVFHITCLNFIQPNLMCVCVGGRETFQN